MGKLIASVYEKLYKRPAPPYVREYSVRHVITIPLRKWLTNAVAANCPFNCIRILLYRMCGFRIGRHTHIGMRCYLDDHCAKLIEIGSHVTISYGVFFTCHGHGQTHCPIRIEDGAYIGMRANLLSKNRDGSENGIVIGKGAVVGACALVNCDVPEGATAVGVPCRILEKEVRDDENDE